VVQWCRVGQLCQPKCLAGPKIMPLCLWGPHIVWLTFILANQNLVLYKATESIWIQTANGNDCVVVLIQLCLTHGPFDGFVRPSLGFRCTKSTPHCWQLVLILIILNLTFFVAGGPQCHFITSVTIAVRIRTLSVH